MNGCVICDISSGAIRSWVVHRDSRVICFLPKELEAYGHTVIAPVDHCPDIFRAPADSMGVLMETARGLALHYRERLGASGINLLHASGMSAQQSVGHLHLHLIPRFDADGIDAWPALPGTDVGKDEFLEVLGRSDPASGDSIFPNPPRILPS